MLIEGLPSLGRYEVIYHVGFGTRSTVYHARDKSSNDKVAIKIIPLSADTSSVEAEIAIIKKIKHPSIVRFIESFKDSEAFYLVFEHLPRGTLLQLLHSCGRFSEDEASAFFAQIVAAVQYLHDTAGVIHRDLKLENVMIDDDFRLKIIDFGLAVQCQDSALDHKYGSAPYLAPELLSGSPCSKESDIWSLGVILYALVTGLFPFGDGNSLSVNDMKRLSFPFSVSADLEDLIRRILAVNSRRRISLAEILNHPWMADGDAAAPPALSPQPAQVAQLIPLSTRTATWGAQPVLAIRAEQQCLLLPQKRGSDAGRGPRRLLAKGGQEPLVRPKLRAAQSKNLLELIKLS